MQRESVASRSSLVIQTRTPCDILVELRPVTGQMGAWADCIHPIFFGQTLNGQQNRLLRLRCSHVTLHRQQSGEGLALLVVSMSIHPELFTAVHPTGAPRFATSTEPVLFKVNKKSANNR